jgi:hypothetical protein
MSLRSAAALLFLFLLPVVASAQAWVSPRGNGSFSISYINDFVNSDTFGSGQHFIIFPNGVKVTDFGEIRTQGAYLDAAYSLTDKLGVSASIPYLSAKYTDPSPNPLFCDPANPTPFCNYGPHQFADGRILLDDGKYHGTFQDFSFKVRYNIVDHPLMITPFVQFSFPSHSYLFFSHAIVGTDTRELQVGVYAGKTLAPIVPKAYLQGKYAHGFEQKVLGISRSINYMELEGGYFIRPDIRAFSIVSGQVTQGGLNGPGPTLETNLGDLGPPIAENPLFFHHTQISRNNILDVGFGAQYSINNRMDIYALLSHSIAGSNMHQLNYGFTFGMSWGFGGSPQRPCHC